MRWRWSLRGRLVGAAALWTAGLFALTVLLINHFPHAVGELVRLPRHPGAMWWTAAISFAAMICGVIVVRITIASFEGLRTRLAAVRDGRAERLEGTYASEVQPLVDDLNALLAQQEAAIARAATRAGDLAHGLKTPLAVLAQEAERLKQAGAADAAASVEEQVHRMRRHVEYHLAHARAAASGATPGARAGVFGVAEALARTLERLYVERALAIQVAVDPAEAVRTQPADLEEMLGNLLDNACKWGRRTIVVRTVREGDRLGIVVEDDGPGLDPEKREAVLARGVRADEAAPGSGLGLAIVRDLAALYGGTLTLGQSRLGGVEARLFLPAA